MHLYRCGCRLRNQRDNASEIRNMLIVCPLNGHSDSMYLTLDLVLPQPKSPHMYTILITTSNHMHTNIWKSSLPKERGGVIH